MLPYLCLALLPAFLAALCASLFVLCDLLTCAVLRCAQGGENIGYIIPAPIISHFLQEVEREGHYRGTCALGLRCQPLESPAARRALGMAEGSTGVLVVSVLPIGATRCGALKLRYRGLWCTACGSGMV